MPDSTEKLASAFFELIRDPPAPADKTDTIWAGTILLSNPDIDADDLHARIKESGMVILRQTGDLAKLEAIVARWKALL